MPDASSTIFLTYDQKKVYRRRLMFPVWGGVGRGREQSSLPILATGRTSTLQSHLTLSPCKYHAYKSEFNVLFRWFFFHLFLLVGG